MTLAELVAGLVARHHDKPQNIERIVQAFQLIRDALSQLEALGHQYHLADGPPPMGEVWPKVYFHIDAAPNGKLVTSQFHLWDLGPGYYPTLSEAQQADGMATQFAGRGGVGRRDLPVVVDTSPSVSSLDARRAKMKADFLARKKDS